MKGLVRQINITIALLLVAAGVCWLAWHQWHSSAPAHARVSHIDAARVRTVRDMVRLCSLEMYEETGINDTINGKGLFAIQRLHGTISYDLEQVRVDSVGPDTLRLILPHERVEWLESTEPGSYRVVDVWNARSSLLKASLTTAEENELKRRATMRLDSLAYSRGYVQRARESAVASLEHMYSLLPDVTVLVE